MSNAPIGPRREALIGTAKRLAERNAEIHAHCRAELDAEDRRYAALHDAARDNGTPRPSQVDHDAVRAGILAARDAELRTSSEQHDTEVREAVARAETAGEVKHAVLTDTTQTEGVA
jgi:hypothetical protein